MDSSVRQLALEMQTACAQAVSGAHVPTPQTVALSRVHGRVLAEAPSARAGADNPQSANAMLCRGVRMSPARVALAAALGVSQLSIYRRPTVALLTIDSAHPPSEGERCQPSGGTRNLLMGLLRADGLEPTAWPPLADDPVQIEIAMRDTACAFDIVLVCADGAVGFEHAAVIAEHFGTVHFSPRSDRCEIPCVLARLDQAEVLIMSPEPVTLLGTYLTLVRTLVGGLEGLATRDLPCRARLQCDLAMDESRLFACVELIQGEDGRVQARPVGGAGLAALAAGNALAIVRASGAAVPAGTVVDVLPYR